MCVPKIVALVLAKKTTVEGFVMFVKMNITACQIVMIVIVKYKTQLVDQMSVIKQVEIVGVKKTT